MKEKETNVQTAKKTMWLPAVNSLGIFGRWAFLEVDGSNLHETKQRFECCSWAALSDTPEAELEVNHVHERNRSHPEDA